jgi:osmotically-inducible protein OsmY
MRKMYGAAAVTLFALSVAFWAGAGRAQQEPRQEGVAEKAGEKLDEFGRAIKKGIENAGEKVREGVSKTEGTVREAFTKTRDTVHGMEVLSRVYGRLHWEKALYSSSLYVKAEGGSVTLRGIVPDEAARAKAVALAAETVGVTRVIDQLSVLTSSAARTGSRPRR